MAFPFQDGPADAWRCYNIHLAGGVCQERVEQLSRLVGTEFDDQAPIGLVVEKRNIVDHAINLSCSGRAIKRFKEAITRSFVTGLVTKSFMPASRQFCSSAIAALAVHAMMYTSDTGEGRRRMIRVAASPSISGIIMSMNTTSQF